jgi:hypothetical protein
MVSVGAPVFLLVPGSSHKKRVLVPGTVNSVNGGVVTASFEQEPPTLEGGADVVIFYNRATKFMQQGAKIVPSEGAAAQATLAFQFVGEAVSAEQRQIYRVCTPLAGIKARVGPETN